MQLVARVLRDRGQRFVLHSPGFAEPALAVGVLLRRARILFDSSRAHCTSFPHEELQQRVREIFLWSARKDGSGLVGYLEGAKIGMPHRIAARTAAPFIAIDARSRGAHRR